MTDPTPTCVGCGRLSADRVCRTCIDRAANRLAILPDLRDRLPLAQVPGGTPTGPTGPRGKRDAAPLPMRLGPFSLLAAGTIDVTPEHANAQDGVIPLEVWAVRWITEFADYAAGEPRVPIPPGRTGAHSSAVLMRRLLTANGKLIEGRRVVVDRRGVAELRGPRALPITDTLDAEYAARWGREDTTGFAAVIWEIAARLDEACALHDDIGGFLLELRVMTDAVRAAVGERSDSTYLGRCPEPRRRDGDIEELCGGALWQDPYTTLLVCPRCRTATHEKYWLRLAERIAEAWPADSAVHELADPQLLAKATEMWRPNQWRAACSCGWTEDVSGGRRDAAGAGRRHLDEVAAAEADARMSA